MSNQLTIRDRLNSDAIKAELARVLPSHCSAERMARVALTAITRTPMLADCDQASFFKCLLDLSQWGLEPDGRRAHLIPFRNNKRNVVECQLIIDYKGLVELAYNSGIVKSIHADIVRDGDLFDYNMGAIRKHVPWFLRRDDDKPSEAGDVFAVYCYVELKDGASKTEVMAVDEIEAVRKRSKAANAGPWETDWSEMAKKTVFRRLTKWIPLSAELREMIERDDDQFEHQRIEQTTQPKRKSLDDLSSVIQPAIEHKQETADWQTRLAQCTNAEQINAFCESVASYSEDERKTIDHAVMTREQQLGLLK